MWCFVSVFKEKLVARWCSLGWTRHKSRCTEDKFGGYLKCSVNGLLVALTEGVVVELKGYENIGELCRRWD